MFCSVPSHRRRIEEVNKWRERDGKRAILLPHWKTNEKGEPPREMHITLYREGESELTLVVRPCYICLRRLLYIYLGIKFERLQDLAPDLAAYVRRAPKFMTEEDVEFKRAYRNKRKLVRIIIEEFEEFRRKQREAATKK